jgi:hypothetical protein
LRLPMTASNIIICWFRCQLKFQTEINPTSVIHVLNVPCVCHNSYFIPPNRMWEEGTVWIVTT